MNRKQTVITKVQ